MRVLLVHNRYRSEAPSGENIVVDQELTQLQRAGHDVARFEKYSDQISQWSLARKAALPVTSVRNRSVRRELAGALNEMRPDIVHIHNTFPLLSASVLDACYDSGVPAVVTFHNYRLQCAAGDFFRNGLPCHDCAGRIGIPGIRHGCYRDSRLATVPLVVGNAYNRAKWRRLVSAYIFVSAAQRKLMEKLCLPEERVFVKHNFVPSLSGSPSLSRDRCVSYVGRLDAAKGVSTLMGAWDRFRERNSKSELGLRIAGGGPLTAQVASWANDRDSVTFSGFLPREEAVDLMRRSLAVVLTSQVEETFGLVALEAMSVGVVPLVPAVGAFPELIRDGVDGMLFAPGDTGALAERLERIDREPDRHVRLGLEGRRVFESRFAPKENTRQLLDIFQYAADHPIGTP